MEQLKKAYRLIRENINNIEGIYIHTEEGKEQTNTQELLRALEFADNEDIENFIIKKWFKYYDGGTIELKLKK